MHKSIIHRAAIPIECFIGTYQPLDRYKQHKHGNAVHRILIYLHSLYKNSPHQINAAKTYHSNHDICGNGIKFFSEHPRMYRHQKDRGKVSHPVKEVLPGHYHGLPKYRKHGMCLCPRMPAGFSDGIIIRTGEIILCNQKQRYQRTYI